MAKAYSPEKLEEMFRSMRERQQQLRELQAGAPKESRISWGRRERQKAQGLPAELQFYRVRELSEMFGVSSQTISRWFRRVAVKAGASGKGPGRPKKTLLISRAALERWLQERT